MSIDLSRWRIEKADKTFVEGEKLLALGLYNGAINRFYYAAFHAARALLATKQLDSSKHSGVIALFNREFVKAGIVSKEAGKILSTTFSLRSEADDDFTTFTFTETDKTRIGVRMLIDEVKSVLNKHLGT
ncbi:MAG: HEPN domain-containing protein [Desulfitobacteriaceae bacterium]